MTKATSITTVNSYLLKKKAKISVNFARDSLNYEFINCIETVGHPLDRPDETPYKTLKLASIQRSSLELRKLLIPQGKWNHAQLFKSINFATNSTAMHAPIPSFKSQFLCLITLLKFMINSKSFIYADYLIEFPR